MTAPPPLPPPYTPGQAPAPQVLLVDADAAAALHLCQDLGGFGTVAQVAVDLAAMRACLASQHTDLLLLDWSWLDGGLSAAVGGSTARQLPVIALSAQAQLIDRVIALEVGADGVLAKPVAPRELVARIRAVLRRSRAAAPVPWPAQPKASRPVPGVSALPAATLNFSGWTLDRQDRRLWAPSGQSSALPDAEFRLLPVLLQSPRRVCSRQQLAAQAGGRTLGQCERSIDLLVPRLRQRLVDGDRPPGLIKTVRGAGYLLDVEMPRRALAATAFTAGGLTAGVQQAGSAAGFAV